MTASFADMFLEAMRYEHWLRFYFLADAEDAPMDAPMQASAEQELAVESQDAIYAVPAEAAARSRAEEPHLAGILSALEGQVISMERSRDIIFDWLGERSGIRPGTDAFETAMTSLAGDAAFRREMDWFHGWVQELANNAIDLKGNALPPNAPRDETVPSFAEWEKAFKFWYGLQKPLGELGQM